MRFLATILAAALISPAAFAQAVDVPFEKFKLSNGLTVIVHEDHKAPVVAVNVWYHVGSKNEVAGKTGFAHLFEHLMFGGSENVKGRFIDHVEQLGATNLNGTTSEDRTNYFETVPVTTLDRILFIESDRMGHFYNAINKEVLDLQRGVVQNELRQYENQPYAIVDLSAPALTFPAGHPYSHSVIGSLADLDAASLEDVQKWFKAYYGPNNAVITIAGDITVAQAKEKINKYFGQIAPGQPIVRPMLSVAKMTGTRRFSFEDRVAQPRLYKIWNVPQFGSAAVDYLDLSTDILAQGRASRLYKRLVDETRLATDVFAGVDTREIASQVYMYATVAPGHTLEEVEKVFDEEIARYLKEGPTAAEVDRARTASLANRIRGLERVGGFGGKSDLLAQSEVFLGSPDAWKISMKRMETATPADLKNAAVEWLSDGVAVMTVSPFPKLQPGGPGVDRTKLPEISKAGPPMLPKLTRDKLSNGLTLVLHERHQLPLVQFNLSFNAGFAADEKGRPGAARLMSRLLTSGTQKRNTQQIAEEQQMLGAQLGAGADLNTVDLYLSALKQKLDPSLELFADVLLNPAFPEKDFQREQQLQLAAIEQEKTQPNAIAFRVLPPLLYGQGHPYATSLSGTGTATSVKQLTRDDVQRYYRTWLKPSNATLIIAGDTTMAEIKPKLEALLGKWTGAAAPALQIASVQPPAKPAVYLIDKPDSPQSFIITGTIAPKASPTQEAGLETMNNMFGGAFGSRLNMNLREDKHWSYGAGSMVPKTRAQRPYIAAASVQTDKTKESLVEFRREIAGILGERPVTDEELLKFKTQQVLRMAGARETLNAVSGYIKDAMVLGFPDDYYDVYPSRVEALRIADISDAAKTVIDPNKLVWVIVGDRKKIEAGVRELNIGEVRVIDADGQSLN
ncbi:MAG TPA: pitrilysin family protein [Bryobacteraceae bacterium]|nr:pitrilysin family protein [Bryobacteraceae bacterium]